MENGLDTMFQVSSNPHVRAKDTTSRIMLYVVIALLPATVFGVFNFGFHALLLVIVTVLTTVFAEYIYGRCMKKNITVMDFSAVVTGLLLALNLPPDAPLWIGVIGGAFAIIVVKMLFGGLGQNFMNPALGARCFLLISFTSIMTNFDCDAYTGATPLAAIKAGEGVNVLDAEYLVSQLAGGGLMLGAFFMATDYVTRPITAKGQYVFGVFLGIMTGIFRLFGPSAEGVSYAIILGNLLVPLIENFTKPAAFGKKKIRKETSKNE